MTTPQWEIKKTKGDSPVFHIYLNGKYFAQTVDEYKANLIIGAFRYGEVHSSVTSAEKVLDEFIKMLLKWRHNMSKDCTIHEVWESEDAYLKSVLPLKELRQEREQ